MGRVALVTGCCGFIERYVTNSLAKAGFRVLGVDNLARSAFSPAKVERFFNLDVRNCRELASIIKENRVEVVVHCAALVSADESVKEPVIYSDINVTGTASALKASVEGGARKFIYVSSAAVYGEPRYLPVDEEHPTEPVSPYDASKLAGEFFVKSIARLHGVGYVILRVFNAYGYGQNREYAGVIARFIERVLAGKPPVVFGDGKQTRDFVHVSDVAEAVRLATEGDVAGTFNIGTGRPTEIAELAKIVIEAAGFDIEPTFTKPRPGDVKHSYADIARAKRVLGWTPRVDLRDGIKALVEAYSGQK